MLYTWCKNKANKPSLVKGVCNQSTNENAQMKIEGTNNRYLIGAITSYVSNETGKRQGDLWLFKCQTKNLYIGSHASDCSVFSKILSNIRR